MNTCQIPVKSLFLNAIYTFKYFYLIAIDQLVIL